MAQRIRRFGVYVIEPGERYPFWTYVTAGNWAATQQDGHGLEFVLSAGSHDHRHVRLLDMLSWYHAGPASQRLDWGHTAPIGEPWMPGSACDHALISLPYAYGPDLERCEFKDGHVRLLAVLPITSAERDLKVTDGIEALEQRLDDTGADFTNPLRPSVA